MLRCHEKIDWRWSWAGGTTVVGAQWLKSSNKNRMTIVRWRIIKSKTAESTDLSHWRDRTTSMRNRQSGPKDSRFHRSTSRWAWSKTAQRKFLQDEKIYFPVNFARKTGWYWFRRVLRPRKHIYVRDLEQSPSRDRRDSNKAPFPRLSCNHIGRGPNQVGKLSYE